MEKKTSPLNLRNTREAEELMGPLPSGFLQYGIGLILLVLLGLVAASRFIPYADVRTVSLHLQPNVRPLVLKAPRAGTLLRPAIADGSTVSRGDTVAWISSADGAPLALTAPAAGTVRLLSFCYEGEAVAAGQPLLEIRPATARPAAVAAITRPAAGENVTDSLQAGWNGRTLHFQKHRQLTAPDGTVSQVLWISRERTFVEHPCTVQARATDGGTSLFHKIFGRKLSLPALPE